MLPIMLDTAPLTTFGSARRTILTGQALRDVRALEASIARFGLLNPVLVSRTDGELRVVDGAKRLAALRRMAFRGTLPRSLRSADGVVVPFIEVETGTSAPNSRTSSHTSPQANSLALLSPIERFARVRDMFAAGLDVERIAADLHAPVCYVAAVLSVANLSPRLRNAWFGGHIALDQARAFATLPCPDSQDALLLALGPFAQAPAILDAIAKGATVVSMGADEAYTLILPSRERLARERSARERLAA